jgi:GTPase
MDGMALKLAILGRPNVGKSTLFNRLAGKQLALVDDQPGVTRDRKEAPGRLGDLDFVMIDTAGFEDVSDGSLEARMRAQTEAAIAEADLALFLVDARAGIMPVDAQLGQILRRASCPVVLAANKAEGRAAESGIAEAWALGLGEPVALSGAHGEGMSDLYDAIRAALSPEAFAHATAAHADNAPDDHAAVLLERLSALDADHAEPGDAALVEKLEAIEAETTGVAGGDDAGARPEKPIRLAIIGRPNAGKSTLINTLLDTQRLVTGPEAGITRDSVPLDWTWQGRHVRLVDTAGLRKRAKVRARLEQLSTSETVRTLRYADIVALVMDAREAMEKQDVQIADLVLREGRGLLLVASKWDLVASPSEATRALEAAASDLMSGVRNLPLVRLSGLTGQRTDTLMPAVIKLHENWSARVKTGDLNRWLRHAVAQHPPPTLHGKPIKPRYMAQIKTRPPTFVLMASRGDAMPEQYKRYLINGIREAFDLSGVPIRLMVRQPANPYARK